VYDCVLWNDGERFRVVVDTDEDGDLGEEKVMTDYGVAQDWSTFGGGSMLNFGVNVYEGGDVLSLVIDSGMHATHVAGIVAAHYPDAPEMNGVAPGAQIVSIKIGDTRIDGMETGQALTRAALAIKRLGVDLVNMSYGEPTRTPNAGQLIEKLAELVDEDGVVFLASAGNAGPALSTVGAPGGSTESIIGVGAAVTTALASNSYSLREAIATNQYTWSSRGPTKDGALGVSISAPGGAFSPVPQWGLTRSLRFNGTSMAAPNACGGIALMLSAAKREGVAYTAGWVKRAVENTAAEMPGVEVYATGRGMLQVGDAFGYLEALEERQLAMPRFEVSVRGGRGVYLREARDVGEVRRMNVGVKAVFAEDADGEAKVGFSLKCALSSDAAWVKAAEWCYLTGGRGQSFEIEVDPTVLDAGVHYAEVVGVDADAPGAGALFRVPVTVVKTGAELENVVTLGGGEMRRWFYEVPVGASWAELEIEAEGIADPRRVVIHAMSVLEGHPHRNVGKRTYATVSPGEETRVRFAVIGGTTLEVCFASYWSNLGEVAYECDLKFRGVTVDEGEVVYGQGDGATRLRVASQVGREAISPGVKFSAVERRLEARKTEVRELTGERDLRGDGTASWELVGTFGFELEEKAEVRVTVPALNDRIYESAFESQLVSLRDERGRVHGVDDAFGPAWFSLEEGKWEVLLHLRGEDKKGLEKLKDLGVVLGRKHATKAGVFAGFDAALTDGAKFGKRTLGRGERAEVFVGGAEKVPGWVRSGDVMVGGVSWQDGGG
ncbi:MAG: S8 family serine peptidase, partial [Verrucomicrobiales bacterium]|nr:S8 family serine peptidase [Verrucomicrobiales bacterium]